MRAGQLGPGRRQALAGGVGEAPLRRLRSGAGDVGHVPLGHAGRSRVELEPAVDELRIVRVGSRIAATDKRLRPLGAGEGASLGFVQEALLKGKRGE